MSTFSIRLKTLRKEHGENQEEVSKFLGVQRTTYSGYERGTIVPPYAKIRKLADRYNVSVDYLTGQSNIANYEIRNEDTIPDIYHQMEIISNELLSKTSVVVCKGTALSYEQKMQIESFIENLVNFMDLMIPGGNHELS